MAERLSEFPGRRNRQRTYPWDEWTDGDAWSIRQGEDYTIKTASMATMLYEQAGLRNCKVQVARLDNDTLAFQFYAKGGLDAGEQ